MKRSSHSRYAVSAGPEGKYQAGSRKRFLRNKLGISNKSEMDKAEFESLVSTEEKYLDQVTEDTVFTANFLCQMHRDWLGSFTNGRARIPTVDMPKEGFAWPPAFRVPDNMARFEDEILSKRTPCRPAEWERIAEDLAVVHAELLLIHPFREGNGRLARWLADLMALQARGPVIDYGFEGKGSRARRHFYLEGVKKGYERDYADLRRFFLDSITRGAAS